MIDGILSIVDGFIFIIKCFLYSTGVGLAMIIIYGCYDHCRGSDDNDQQ